jgi:hypothetical protein
MGGIRTTAMGLKYFLSDVQLQFVSLCFLQLYNSLPLKFCIFVQSWISARDYCCSLGMRLASFPTMAHFEDCYDTFKYCRLYGNDYAMYPDLKQFLYFTSWKHLYDRGGDLCQWRR